MKYLLILILSFWIVLLSNFAKSQNEQDIVEWFRSLKTPNQIGNLPAGISCCDQSDCKRRNITFINNKLHAFIEEVGSWVEIPAESEITDKEVLQKRPFFQAVVCYVPGRGIICYVPGNTGG